MKCIKEPEKKKRMYYYYGKCEHCHGIYSASDDETYFFDEYSYERYIICPNCSCKIRMYTKRKYIKD